MLEKVARYGSFKKRDAPNEPSKGVVDNVDKVVNKKVSTRKLLDVFNPFEIFDYDVNYEEVVLDESDIHEQDS